MCVCQGRSLWGSRKGGPCLGVGPWRRERTGSPSPSPKGREEGCGRPGEGGGAHQWCTPGRVPEGPSTPTAQASGYKPFDLSKSQSLPGGPGSPEGPSSWEAHMEQGPAGTRLTTKAAGLEGVAPALTRLGKGPEELMVNWLQGPWV